MKNSIHVEILNIDNDSNFTVVIGIDNQQIRRTFGSIEEAEGFLNKLMESITKALWSN